MLREGEFVYLLVEVYEVTPYTTSVEQLCRRVGFRRIVVHPRTEGRNYEGEPGVVYSLSSAMTLLHSPSSPNCHTYPAQIKFVASLRTVDLPARCTVSVFKTPVSDLPHLPRPMISIKELPNGPLLSRQDYPHRELNAPLLNRQDFVHRELNASLLTKEDFVHRELNASLLTKEYFVHRELNASLLTKQECVHRELNASLLTKQDVVHRELPQPVSTRVATQSKLPMNTSTSAQYHSIDSLAELLGLEESDEDLPEVMLLTPSPTSFEHDKSADTLPLVMPLTLYAEDLPVVMPLTPSPMGVVHNKIEEHLPVVRPLTLCKEDHPVVMPLNPSPVRFVHGKSAQYLPPVMPLPFCAEDISAVTPLNPSPKKIEHEKSVGHLPPVMPLPPCAEDSSVVTRLNPSPKKIEHEKSVGHLPPVMPLPPCAEDSSVVTRLNPSPKKIEHEKSVGHLPPVMPLPPCAEELSVVKPLNPPPIRFEHEKSVGHLPVIRPLTPCVHDLQVTAYVREALKASLVARSEQMSSHRKQSSSLHELPRVPPKELTAAEQHRQLSSAMEATRTQTTEASACTKETLQLPSVKTSASYARTAAQETVSFMAVQRLPQPPTRTKPGITFVDAKKKKKRTKRILRFVGKRTILDDLPVAIKTVPMVRRTF